MYTTTNIFRHISEFCWSTQEKRTHHTATQNEAAKTRKMWNFHEFSFSFAQINIFSQLSLTHCAVCCVLLLELSFFLPFFLHCSTEHFILTLWARFFSLPSQLFFYILQQHDIRPEKSENDTKLASEENFSSFKLSCMLADAGFLLAMEQRKRKRISTREIYGEASTKKVILFVAVLLGNVSLQTLLKHRLDFCRSFCFFVAELLLLLWTQFWPRSFSTSSKLSNALFLLQQHK